MKPCPVCNLSDGFHDHKDVVVPPQNILPKTWLAEMLKARKALVK